MSFALACRALRRMPGTVASVASAASITCRTFHSTRRASNHTVELKKFSGRSAVSGVVATVFGASGSLGRYVVNHLAQSGAQVILPYRNDGMDIRHLKLTGDLGQIVPVKFHARHEESLTLAMRQSNVVINLMGAEHATNNFSLDDIHVQVPKRIAEIAKTMPELERFVQISAVGASEDSTCEFLATKARGEKAVREVLPNATIVRSCHMFGWEDKLLNRWGMFAQFLPFMPVFDRGQQLMQPVHLEDVALGLLATLDTEDGVGATYELGGPEQFAMIELLAYMYLQMAKHPQFVPIHPALARLYGKAVGLLPSKFRYINADIIERLGYDSVVNTEDSTVKTFADLGVTPVPINSLAAQIMTRYRGQRYVDEHIKES
jgi:NADH dehydrogenase (ubiquinone) 1 alpha subcomplex subunit 9